MRDEAEKRIRYLYPTATLPGGFEGDGDRLAKGAHGPLAPSRGQRRDGATGFDFHAFHEAEQESLGGA